MWSSSRFVMFVNPNFAGLIYLSGRQHSDPKSYSQYRRYLRAPRVIHDAPYPALYATVADSPIMFITPVIPNNSDAAFKKRTKKPKPSDLLPHCNYGPAAVKQWNTGRKPSRNVPSLLAHSCPYQPQWVRKRLRMTGIQ